MTAPRCNLERAAEEGERFGGGEEGERFGARRTSMSRVLHAVLHAAAKRVFHYRIPVQIKIDIYGECGRKSFFWFWYTGAKKPNFNISCLVSCHVTVTAAGWGP